MDMVRSSRSSKMDVVPLVYWGVRSITGKRPGWPLSGFSVIISMHHMDTKLSFYCCPIGQILKQSGRKEREKNISASAKHKRESANKTDKTCYCHRRHSCVLQDVNNNKNNTYFDFNTVERFAIMVDLDEYREGVRQLRQYAAIHNVSEAQTSEIFQACFRQLEAKYSKKSKKRSRSLRIILSLVFISIILLCLCQSWLNIIFIRISQNSIYPALYTLRKAAVPIVSLYPSLSELYDEWCLIENPYFYVNDMDCWPCTMAHSVLNLTGHNISRAFNVGIPYTRAENNTTVKMKDLVNLYWSNQDVFDQDAKRIFSNNKTFKTIRDVMDNRLDIFHTATLATHISWRINRMKPNRILRKLFPKPAETPNWWSQGTEKYIFIDESGSPSYPLPNPECSNIVIRCVAGARLIKMTPSSECVQHCRSSTILLSAGHTLWYSWWYWRPVSLPVYNATALSIDYLTSFC